MLAAGIAGEQDAPDNTIRSATMSTQQIPTNIKEGIINTFIVYGILCVVVWVCVYVGFKIASAA